jgi:hypothetical protein
MAEELFTMVVFPAVVAAMVADVLPAMVGARVADVLPAMVGERVRGPVDVGTMVRGRVGGSVGGKVVGGAGTASCS